MTSPLPSPLPRVRTPRLTYRTKSSDESSVQTNGTDYTRYASSTQPTSPTTSDFSPLPSPGLPGVDQCSQFSSRRPSLATNTLSSGVQEKPSKKRSKFFSGLFNVKEPSAQALIEYQRQLSKRDAQGQNPVRPVGMPGVSSASLPSSVPKVNSKWDGIPQTVKEREKKQQQLAARRSVATMNTGMQSGLSDESRASRGSSQPRRPKSRQTLGGMSTYSDGSQNRLAELYGWEITEFTDEDAVRESNQALSKPISPNTTSSVSLPTPKPPAVIVTDIASPPKTPDKILERSVTSENPSPSAPGAHHTPISKSSDSPLMALNGLAANISPPVTPDQTTASTQWTSMLGNEVVVTSTGSNVLGPPASAKRRPSPLHDQRPKTSGTGETATSYSESNHLSKGTTSSPAGGTNVSTRHQRRKSAQDRLSLGINLKHQAVAPWTWSELHPETKAVTNDPDRVLSPSPQEGSQSTRRKRLTLLKK